MKIGDRVKILGGALKGKVGVVIKYDDTNDLYLVKIDRTRILCSPYNLEKQKDYEFDA